MIHFLVTASTQTLNLNLTMMRRICRLYYSFHPSKYLFLSGLADNLLAKWLFGMKVTRCYVWQVYKVLMGALFGISEPFYFLLKCWFIMKNCRNCLIFSQRSRVVISLPIRWETLHWNCLKCKWKGVWMYFLKCKGNGGWE